MTKIFKRLWIEVDTVNIVRDLQSLIQLMHSQNEVIIFPIGGEGLYMVRRETALKNKMRYGEKVCFLYADAVEKVDVNYPDDFELANFLAAGIREKERELFRNLSSLLTSSMLSDILDQYGVQGVINDLKPNLDSAKVLGRANTLKLRQLEPNENFMGLYDALKSYKFIVPGDIILVENECPEYAYFGNLNASLAMRSGAVAAIVGGMTRDYSSVKNLGFPVFSKGYNCKDVLKRATTASLNKTIQISGVTIHPGELVFADKDGIVVIPEKFEKEILSQAFDTVRKESKIMSEIIAGTNAFEIVNKIGAF